MRSHLVLRSLCLLLLALAACQSSAPSMPLRSQPSTSPGAGSPGGQVTTPRPSPAPTGPRPAAKPSAKVEAAPRFVLWKPGGLSDDEVAALKRLPAARDMTTVTGGLHQLQAQSPGQDPPGSMTWPLEVAYVEPRAYQRVMAPGGPGLIGSLDARTAILAETSAKLRGTGSAPVQLTTDRTTVATIGVVPDEVAGGFEVLLAGPPPPDWGNRYALFASETDAASLQRSIGKIVAKPFRLSAEGSFPFLRYADSVLPQMIFKKGLGEFAMRPLPSGGIAVDPSWRRKNIVEERVPILGEVTCHRKMMPRLRAAMKSIVGAGLANQVDPADFGGCYSPRFIGSDPNGRLSAHAWGGAFDINASSNPLGAEPDLGEALVNRLISHGLTWGGGWLIPDGMHFEWFPSHLNPGR